MEEVCIGMKDLRNYVMACIHSLSDHDSVKILARGSHIKTAVDAAEIVKRKSDNLISIVEISSEKYNDRWVSAIEIVLRPEDIRVT